MIIDAMDLICWGPFSGFCIVSSDSVSARLAARIREQGITFDGFGELKTPRQFITACDKLVYVDVLSGAAAETKSSPQFKAAPKPEVATRDSGNPGGEKSTPSRGVAASRKLERAAIELLRQAVEASAEEDGWTADLPTSSAVTL